MITVAAPINLIEFGQPLFSLAWKAVSLGAEPYLHSETHAAYPIKPEHSAMIDHATIEGIVGAGGDIYNMALFIEIDPDAEHHEDEEGNSITWAEYAASINHIPTEIDGKFYLEATDGQTNMTASEVIASGLTWFTTDEFKAMMPVSGV